MRSAAPLFRVLSDARCVALVAIVASASGCTASSDDVRPPGDQLFFPTGLAIAPPETRANVLFVTNSNSELRYDTGSISVIDLAVVDAVINAWLTSRDTGTCDVDPDHRETLVCDEAMFIKAGAGVRIGNFATEIALQNFSPADGSAVKLRAVVPTRGDPSIAWADYDGTKLSCGGSSAFPVCDEAHRLAGVLNDPDLLPLPDEPFGVFATTQPADPSDPFGKLRGFAMVTHLSNGAVTLIDAPEDGPVQITDVTVGVFAQDPVSGQLGATGIAGRSPGTENNLVYVGSRSEDRIQTFTVGRPINNAPPFLLAGINFFLEGVGEIPSTGESVDGRGIQFSPTGDRLYLVNRFPPTLQIYDTTLGPTGVPRNRIAGASDICRQASTVAVLDSGDGERAYVTCFQDGEIYVVDPRGSSQVEDIVSVGRGPYAVAAAKDQQRLFVSNYLEDTIAVVDVKPDSPTRNRVVLRIGESRAP